MRYEKIWEQQSDLQVIGQKYQTFLPPSPDTPNVGDMLRCSKSDIAPQQTPIPHAIVSRETFFAY
jgi:hypothetical protein